MEITDFVNSMQGRGAELILNPEGKLMVKPKSVLTDEDRDFIRANINDLVAALMDGDAETFAAPSAELLKLPTLETQLSNYQHLYLASKGGRVGQPAHYYSPSVEEFERMSMAAKAIEAQYGRVKLVFNFALSFDCEVMEGPSVGTIFRIFRDGRMEGAEDHGTQIMSGKV